MTKVKLSLDEHQASNIDLLKRCPYSFEYAANQHFYEIIGWGYEHLIPNCFLADYFKKNYLEQQIASSQTGTLESPSINLDYSLKNIATITDIKNTYKKAQCLDFKITSKDGQIILSEFKPLKRIDHSRNKDFSSTSIAYNILQKVLKTLKMHSSKTNVVTLKLTKDSEKDTFERSLQSIKGGSGDYIVRVSEFELQKYKKYYDIEDLSIKIPAYLLYFRSLKQSLLHFLELKKALLSKLEVPQLPQKKQPIGFYNLLNFLNVIGFEDTKISNLSANCKAECLDLENPIDRTLKYCKDPLRCFLKKEKLSKLSSQGNSKLFTIFKDKLYIFLEKDKRTRSKEVLRYIKNFLILNYDFEILKSKSEQSFDVSSQKDILLDSLTHFNLIKRREEDVNLSSKIVGSIQQNQYRIVIAIDKQKY